jgi:hypothetical protein
MFSFKYVLPVWKYDFTVSKYDLMVTTNRNPDLVFFEIYAARDKYMRIVAENLIVSKPNNFCPLPEIIDPVFAKTSQNARFLLSENERFGLVFVKTGSINSGNWLLAAMFAALYFCYQFDNCKTLINSFPKSQM